MDRVEGRGQKFQREVPVGDGIHGIRHRALKTEKLCCHVAVVGKPVPASAAAPSGDSFTRTGIGKTSAVATEHLDIGHKMKSEGHRLRRLKVGESRHQRVGMFRRPPQQRVLKGGKRGVDRIISSRTQSRKSVATWSLRERAV